MTIIGKSKAACAMIFDAIKSNPFGMMYQVKIFNNLKLDGDIFCENKKVEEVEFLNDFEFVLGAVRPPAKRKIVSLFNLTYQTMINKTAFVSSGAKIGAGTIIDGLAYISNGVTLGKYVTIYSGATVAHDSTLADYVTICPNVAVCGEVKIGEGTFIGAGSVIKNGITIGKNCVIGCGAVVVKDVPDGVTIFGNPAKEHQQENIFK